MRARHDQDFLTRRDAILGQLAAALQAYGTVTDEHEQQLIDTTDFRRAGSHEQGKSACLELTIRCYPDGKIELEPHRHASEGPKNKSEMYSPPNAVTSVAGAVALLCARAIEKARTYSASGPETTVSGPIA